MILICILLLSGLGAAIIGSVAPSLLLSQVAFYLLGLALFWLTSRFDYRIFKNLAPIAYLASVALLIVTLIIGLETRGSTRWISVGSFRLQFSELLKPILLACMASFLTIQKKFYVLPLMGLPVLLIFRQPDLGSALVYSLAFLTLLFTGVARLSYLASLLTLGLISFPAGWNLLADYQKKRLLSFLTPGFDPQGVGYNAVQAVIAVGSGMLFGRGLGRGTQSHLLFLPEHHTDFVFASVSEELGFVGAAFLLAIYFLLIWRIFSVAFTCPDKFGSLLALGIGALLLAQVFINVSMNLGLFPVTGITLPLISYGGSSVLSTMVGLGVVENISRLAKRDVSSTITV